MIASPLPRIPYAKAAKTLLRQSVLTVVDELIRKDGWAATSVATVANATGVSRQTIYNEFGSRQSIAEAYILHRLDVLLDAVSAKVLGNPDIEHGFREAFELFFDMVDEPVIQTVLAGDRSNLIDLVKVVNERATDRLAAVILRVRPRTSESDAVIFADSLARIAVAHAMAPTLPRPVAIERVVRLSTVVLDAP